MSRLERAQEADGCLCYTTDRGYALPTLLSAAQARKHLSARTDVVVILIGTAREEEALAAACVSAGVRLVSVRSEMIDGQPIYLARHFLDRLLDVRYRRVVHIDGDTQVLGSLDALLDVQPAPGRVIAAPDPMALMIDGPGASWERRRAYFASIGIAQGAMRRYVNTGMFCARREDLGAIGAECRKLALQAGRRYVFTEQDAFNVALGSSIDLASIRWNYPAFFANFAFGHLVEPKVRHFMSNPRPWQGAFQPWGRDGHTPYAQLLLAQPQLRLFHTPLGPMRALRYALQQRVKRLVEPRAWDRRDVRERLQRLESAAVV